MIYHLSTISNNQQGYERLADLAKATAGLREDRLELSFARVGFFEANMAAPLGAVLARIADRLNVIEIVSVPERIEAILRKNGFLVHHRYLPLEDDNQTTVPFRRLQRTDEGVFEEYLQRNLQGKGIPRMSAGLGKVFKQKLFEVFQNAVIHSDSDLGIYVCGQFFPQKHKMDLTIADAGIGIRENVRRRFGNNQIGSVPAIRWALVEGNTTKTGTQPGGLGLKLLHEFTALNKGRIQIVSRFGFYEFCNGAQRFAKMTGDFRGTAVTLEVNTADTAAYRLSSEVQSNEIF